MNEVLAVGSPGLAPVIPQPGAPGRRAAIAAQPKHTHRGRRLRSRGYSLEMEDDGEAGGFKFRVTAPAKRNIREISARSGEATEVELPAPPELWDTMYRQDEEALDRYRAASARTYDTTGALEMAAGAATARLPQRHRIIEIAPLSARTGVRWSPRSGSVPVAETHTKPSRPRRRSPLASQSAMSPFRSSSPPRTVSPIALDPNGARPGIIPSTTLPSPSARTSQSPPSKPSKPKLPTLRLHLIQQDEGINPKVKRIQSAGPFMQKDLQAAAAAGQPKALTPSYTKLNVKNLEDPLARLTLLRRLPSGSFRRLKSKGDVTGESYASAPWIALLAYALSFDRRGRWSGRSPEFLDDAGVRGGN